MEESFAVKQHWDAEGYQSDFQFVHQYGEDVLKLLGDVQGQRVLDLGCGNGVLTARLASMGAEAVGMDRSEEMLRLAREQHPELMFCCQDASAFSFDEPFDAVFSNAVFHWIPDQDGLLQSIVRALKPGGRLVCEFGGAGCCETIHAAIGRAFARRGKRYRKTFYFPSIGEYAPRMERNGLKVELALLFDRPTLLKGENGLADWIEMFVGQSFEGFSPAEKAEMFAEVVEELRPVLLRPDGWYADYVRIRIRAVKE